jgi:hypothetical protein
LVPIALYLGYKSMFISSFWHKSRRNGKIFYGFCSQLTPKGKTRRGKTKKLRGKYIIGEDTKNKKWVFK